MRGLIYAGIGLAALWLQLTLGPALGFVGVKPDLPLITVAVLGLRWREPWLFLYGAGLGVALDVFSHGMLGVYGLSFFAVSLVARLAGGALYESNALFTLVGVLALSVLEAVISLTVFNILDPAVSWWGLFLTIGLPASLYNGLLAPLLLYALEPLERAAPMARTL